MDTHNNVKPTQKKTSSNNLIATNNAHEMRDEFDESERSEWSKPSEGRICEHVGREAREAGREVV